MSERFYWHTGVSQTTMPSEQSGEGLMSTKAARLPDPRSAAEIRSQLADLAKALQQVRAYGARDFASSATLQTLETQEAELLEKLHAAESAERHEQDATLGKGAGGPAG
jgi:hypothetical protein